MSNPGINQKCTILVYQKCTVSAVHAMEVPKLGNRLLNWPKLLEVYADGFYSIFVPECVPYIIPHMFQ